jgi:hypothetical protein
VAVRPAASPGATVAASDTSGAKLLSLDIRPGLDDDRALIFIYKP